MYHLFIITLCSAFIFVGNFSAIADDAATFPVIIPAEQPPSPLEELDENIFVEKIGYELDDVYLNRIHSTAYSHLFAVSEDGDVVQMHDASRWTVNPRQGHLVLYWVKDDNIFIKPCISWFSSYNYVLHNYTRNEVVQVNLRKAPLAMGINTYRITHIDPYHRFVSLSNNTVWHINLNDQNFAYWQIGQRLLVGLNNHWRTEVYPHILINVDMHNSPYSQALFYGNAVH